MEKSRIITNEEKNLILTMYNNGDTYMSIREALHCKECVVTNFIKENGLPKRKRNSIKGSEKLKTNKIYTYNESYFEEINTSEKAYWLGFLYADGYVTTRNFNNGSTKGGVLEFTLKHEDGYMLNNFLKHINGNQIIKERIINLNNKQFKADRLSINGIDFVNDLISHGCVQTKSLILDYPIGVPLELQSHFVRGYFDGDGCVAFYPKCKSFSYQIMGTPEVLQYIKNCLGIEFKDVRIFKSKSKAYQINISGKKKIEIFHNYIYKNKTIFLERKYQNSYDMLSYRNLENLECSETSKIFANLFKE